jgi:trimeric autotransporter adhesin
MPTHVISINGILTSLNCHFQNIHKTSDGRQSSQRAVLPLFVIALFCVLECASGSAPLSLSSNSISFGSVTVGGSMTRVVTLTNPGTRSVRILEAAVKGAGFGFSGPGLPLTLGSNQSTTFGVSFAPTASGSVSGSLTIVINFHYAFLSIALSGTGVVQSPSVAMSANSLAFGSQAVGATSAAHTVTLSNTGNGALSITGIALTGANPGDFAQSNNCGGGVAAGGNCTISVTFTPAASGSFTAAVSVADNASGSPQTVALSGTGAMPGVSLSPSNLSFGNEPVGVVSPAQTITLSNTGNAALSITGLALTGANPSEFAQSNNCGAGVAAGANCTISVTFTPAASGSFTAAVSIADNASASPQTVALSGMGASPGVSLSPSSLAFGSVPMDSASSLQTISLSNAGNAVLSITSLAIGGGNSSDFAETADTCGSSVVAGGSCTIGITFTPSLAGAETASITVNDNAGDSPQTVALSGTGAHDVILTWAASTTSGVAGYNVYRGATSGGEGGTPLNSTPIAGTTFTDSNVLCGQAYYYVVTTVAADGTEQSPDSSEVSATVPSP